ncbi:MAG: hypothetical protein AAF411_24525, partial [Myxococcota bacterium]
WVNTASDRTEPDQVLLVRDPRDGRILVKRVSATEGARFLVASDHPSEGRDSRHFGWLDATHRVGRCLAVWSTSRGGRAL